MIWASGLQAQQIVEEALQAFPSQTERLEYSNLKELCQLSNYEILRQRCTGPRLQDLEKSYGKVGIQERDIDELALGWETATGDLYGLATGQFRSDGIAGRAAGDGLMV